MFTKAGQRVTVRVKDSGGYVAERSEPGPDISKAPSGGSDDDDD